ncbi:MAG: hypothetical protein K2Y37_19085 [Pirellulales bacterium]|nr:hypothetical protein [Pirellulales bacterium]
MNRYPKGRRFSGSFRDSCLVVAENVYGQKGVWAYESFAFINQNYFDGRLPWPQIVWALTEHGGCVAWASASHDKSKPPVITLHPSLLRGSEKKRPWGIDARWLGPSLAFDTLLHECMHAHIDYNLGGQTGRTSHDCERWTRQVNRIAKLMGFEGIHAGRTKCVRVPDRNAPRTVRGKFATTVVRKTLGNIPFRAVASFPQGLREHLGLAAAYYSMQKLPDGVPRLTDY